ncbi:MAG: sensor histidine kinase [Steroidobacteraceae bacterium]
MLFIPFAWRGAERSWLLPTLLTIPVFLMLYFRHHGLREGTGLRGLLLMASLGYILMPVNPYAIVYLTFAVALAPLIMNGLLRPILLTLALNAALAFEILLLDGPYFLISLSTLICLVTCLGNAIQIEKYRKQAALKLSQDEIRRLAALVERERIGRDLHDLLGHTLSLIAIKSELAGRLLQRDAEAAAREIHDVTDVARQALKQVRTAVSGIRAAALEVELLSARALLESSGIQLLIQHDERALPPDIETHLAMMLREAVTNIHKHAHATQARVEINFTAEQATLLVADNGRGGLTRHGNGLRGIEERARAVGGQVQFDSSTAGTTLNIRLPLKAAATAISEDTKQIPSITHEFEQGMASL